MLVVHHQNDHNAMEDWHRITQTTERSSYSMMEAPKPPDTVERSSSPLSAICSGHPSRSVPVFGIGEGALQLARSGKCTYSLNVCAPEICNLLSQPSSFSNQSPDPASSSSPGCSVDFSNSGPCQPPSMLAIYYQNVRGLRTKIIQLRLLLASCDYDVLVFSETWLREDIGNSEITSDYVLFRCDRSALTSQYARGGGVMIAVKNHLCCEMLPVPNCERLEQIAICVKAANRSFFVVVAYLPPNSHVDLYSTHASAVQYVLNCASNTDIVLSLGDFNLPNLRWQFDTDVNGFIPSNVTSEQEKSLIESLFAAGLRQVNNFTNVNGRLLDLAFVNLSEHLDVVEPATPLLAIDSHHMPFVLLLDGNCERLIEFDDFSDRYNYDFYACDYILVKSALANIDWNIVLRAVSLDSALSAFYDKLYAVCNELIPRKKPKFVSLFNQSWWTLELRQMRNQLRKVRRRFFFTKSEIDRITLREAESSYRTVLLDTHQNYLASIQASVKENPSRFWDFVKDRKSSNRVSSNVSYENTQASSNSEAANLFASFFESVFSKASPVARHNCFDHILSQVINLPFIQFSTNEVLAAIDDLDSKKGAGTDGIPAVFLKNCSTVLVTPLTLLFNRSLHERTFPAVWKSAFVVPIHKSGNVNRVMNYRGVSILCCLSKIFEKLMHNVLYTVALPIISYSQHGFMKHRSTSTNLMCYVTELSREVEMRRQVDAVYVDFAKAFDTVPHNLVVEKLRHIGFPDWLTEWLSSYLSNRTSRVVVNSARSRSFCNTSGVPQGSVLGPLIFNIYVNDLCMLISSRKLSFADDLKLYRVIRSPSDFSALQEDINTMLVWCSDNGMRVNNAKCKVISFSRSNNPSLHQYSMETDSLQRVTTICDLGVTIDAKLRFNDHIGITCAKAFSVLGFIRRHASEFTDVYVLKTLYCSLVRSILEYASPVWSPYYVAHSISLERVQRKFIRFALRLLPWNDPINLPSYIERCRLIDLESLSARRIKAQRLFIYDVVQGVIDCPALLEQVPLNIPPRRFRNSNLLAVPYHRTNYGLNNPLDSCIRLFNDLSDEFDFNVTRSVFKKSLRRIV